MTGTGVRDLRGALSILGGLVLAIPLVCLAFVRHPPVSVAQAHRRHQPSYLWINQRDEEAWDGLVGGFTVGSLSGYGYACYLRRRKPPEEIAPQEGDWPPPPKVAEPPAV